MYSWLSRPKGARVISSCQQCSAAYLVVVHGKMFCQKQSMPARSLKQQRTITIKNQQLTRLAGSQSLGGCTLDEEHFVKEATLILILRTMSSSVKVLNGTYWVSVCGLMAIGVPLCPLYNTFIRRLVWWPMGEEGGVQKLQLSSRLVRWPSMERGVIKKLQLLWR